MIIILNPSPYNQYIDRIDFNKLSYLILNDVEAKGAFGSLISMLVENAEWLDIEMYKNMRNILKGYELYPKYFSAKRMIIEDVVTDFYIFLILFMDHEYYLPELLERKWYFEVDMSKYCSLIIDTLNHDCSVSSLLNPADKIKARLEKYKEEQKKEELSLFNN